MTAQPFTCVPATENDLTVVRARGDLDIAGTPLLSASLDRVLTPSATVVLDCAGITFCDASGVHALVQAHRTAHDRRCRFALTAVPASLFRLLELVRVLDLLEILPSPEKAFGKGHPVSIDSRPSQVKAGIGSEFAASPSGGGHREPAP